MENWEKALLRKKELIAQGHTSAIGGATHAKRIRRMRMEMDRLLDMPLEKFKELEPRSVLQWVVMNALKASDSKGNEKAMAIKVLCEVRDTLGEKPALSTKEMKNDDDKPAVINDLPTATDTEFPN